MVNGLIMKEMLDKLIFERNLYDEINKSEYMQLQSKIYSVFSE